MHGPKEGDPELPPQQSIRSRTGLPWWLSGKKNSPANAGDTGSNPSPGRSHMPWSN